MRKFVYTLTFVLILAQTILAQVNWQQSPGVYGGEVRCVAVAPNGFTYIGSPNAGIFKTTDQGNNWSRVNTGFVNLNVRELAFNTSGHIFAATLDGTNSGIIRSTNNGVNWNYTALTNADVRTLTTNSSGHIFAGTDTNGVYRSTDNGVSFTQINNGLTVGYINSIAIKSTGEVFAGTRYGGVFRSTDNGNNWSQVNTGLANQIVYAVAVNPVNGYLFVGTGNSVYRSTNNGGIWTYAGLANQSINELVIKSDGRIYATVDGPHVYFSKSTDGGGTWSSPLPLIHLTTNTSLVVNNFDGRIYIGTYLSIHRSTNDGDSFLKSDEGLAGLTINSLLSLPNNNYVFAGCKFQGISRTTNGGTNWFYYEDGIDFNAFALNSFNFIYAGGLDYWYGSSRGNIRRSTNNGANFPVTESFPSQSIQSLVISYLDYIFAGTVGSGIYRSVNNGTNWTAINLSNNNVYSLATDSIGYIYAGTGGGKIFRSTDNGFVFNQVYISPITTNNVRSLTKSKTNIIYAGLDTGGIITSSDNGTTWIQSSFTIPRVNAIAFSSQNYIYVGTGKNGVYESRNNGSNWTQINTGLTNTSIKALAFDNNNYLYCGTYGSSVFKIAQPIIGIQNISTEIPSKYSLGQNYPNPFNPITNVKFSIVNAGDVKLVVYDIQGREVQTLINESLKPGTYEVSFDGSSLTSGVFFYKLMTDGFTETKRMILIK